LRARRERAGERDEDLRKCKQGSRLTLSLGLLPSTLPLSLLSLLAFSIVTLSAVVACPDTMGGIFGKKKTWGDLPVEMDG
jgi:hypothetical protein